MQLTLAAPFSTSMVGVIHYVLATRSSKHSIYRFSRHIELYWTCILSWFRWYGFDDNAKDNMQKLSKTSKCNARKGHHSKRVQTQGLRLFTSLSLSLSLSPHNLA